MEKTIRDNKEIEFDKLLPILQEAYANKKCKSCLSIRTQEEMIELIPRGKTMPLIWIVKNPTPL